MDKYEQIVKLAEAAALIQNVMRECDPEFADDLDRIADEIAEIADNIEGVEG